MSDASQPNGGARRRAPTSRRGRALALGLLAGVACALIAYLAFGPGTAGRAPGAGGCTPPAAPPVAQVAPGALGALRAALARVLPERVGRLYEEGTVLPLDAWRDGEPSAPPVARTAARPAAFELRWWAPNDDDVVADVFSFSSQGLAARFLSEAASARCREDGRVAASAGPPQARNLTWVNPDGVAEADVFVRRGARVYRVADVPAGQSAAEAKQLDMTRALAAVDTLACLLPDARCERGSSDVVPA